MMLPIIIIIIPQSTNIILIDYVCTINPINYIQNFLSLKLSNCLRFSFLPRDLDLAEQSDC